MLPHNAGYKVCIDERMSVKLCLNFPDTATKRRDTTIKIFLSNIDQVNTPKYTYLQSSRNVLGVWE